MGVLGRGFGQVLRALWAPRHYLGLCRGLYVYRRPFRQIRRYLTMGGDYPDTVEVRTPLGPIALRLYAPDDLVTVNEIFCRNDYRPLAPPGVVVDIGANIGISAAYWLTRAPDAFAYLFEPLPQNLERLEANLQGFAGRYRLERAAVGTEDGPVEFHWETTGRYGGVGKAELPKMLTVPCRDAARVVREVADRHGRIDLLKVDVEGLETAILDRIPDDLRPKIAQIVVEHPYAANPWPRLYAMRVRGLVTRFAFKAGPPYN